MGKIERIPSNIYEFPQGAFLRNKIYVYINISNTYVAPKEKKGDKKGTRGYTDHNSVCIGVVTDIDNPRGCRKLYANDYYKKEFLSEELPEPPRYADGLSVGLSTWISEAAEQCGLIDDLSSVFNEDDIRLILDLAHYMISKESAVMQHFPAWGRDHLTLSDIIRDDNYIGTFLKNSLTISKINLFKDIWFTRNIGEGLVFLCYDSTNVNSQARGVTIVQKGHAKDDSTLDQVNTDYVVRQSDGLPLTMLHSPGSVNDIAQAQEMIQFIDRMKRKSGATVRLCMICDRGYISEKNLRLLDAAGLEYILMLRSNFSLHEKLAEEVAEKIRSYKHKVVTYNDEELYGVTKECTLYNGGPGCYAQVVWSAERYGSERHRVEKRIDGEREQVTSFLKSNRDTCFIEDELKWIPPYFCLKTEPGPPRIEEKKKRGRGSGTRKVEIPTMRVIAFQDDEAGINKEFIKAGIFILITRKKMTVQETIDAYSKRDCVEKVFESLKSHLGMDKIGVTTEEAMHGKGFIWFIASILHSLMFNETKTLRISDRKHYTVPTMVDQLEAIKADKDLKTLKYRRRYKLTARQQRILKCWDISEKFIDEKICQISI